MLHISRLFPRRHPSAPKAHRPFLPSPHLQINLDSLLPSSTAMATYTPEQLTAYLTHIRFPNPISPPPPPTLETLELLVTHHLSTIPFENLSIHYRSSSSCCAAPSEPKASPIDVSPGAALEKLVPRSAYPVSLNGDLHCGKDARNGVKENGVRPPLPESVSRGGYCMEVNTVFSTVLRTLGYKLWTIGGRASRALVTGGKDKSGEFSGWDHMATIVDLTSSSSASTNGVNGATGCGGMVNGLWYVDVGFGGDGPRCPIPVRDGAVVVGQGAQRHRLIRLRPSSPSAAFLSSSPHADLGWVMQTGRALPPDDTSSLAEDEKNSVIETTTNPDGTVTRIKWSDGHNFYPLVPYTIRDYTVMSFCTATHPESGMRSLVMCVRMLRDDEITPEERAEFGEGVKGRIALRDMWLTRKVEDKAEVVEEFETEEQRVEALRRWFGIEVEREGIRGGRLEINESNLKRWREEEEKKKKRGE